MTPVCTRSLSCSNASFEEDSTTTAHPDSAPARARMSATHRANKVAKHHPVVPLPPNAAERRVGARKKEMVIWVTISAVLGVIYGAVSFFDKMISYLARP